MKDVAARFDEVMEALASPETMSDMERFRELGKEQKRLTPIIEKYREYQAAAETISDAEAILAEETDPEMREMCSAEVYENRAKCEKIEEELKMMLLPRDENDDRNVVMEIRAGAGGEEAALFAYVLYRMYTMFAASAGYKTEIVNLNETGLGGFKEVTFTVEGTGAFSRLKFESGVHRVQRVPETESQGRIHTSTVTVAVLPEAEDVEVDIDPGDLKIDTIKSTGAGGQHINKTESAIRLTHLPTGIVIECQDERSQHKNREKAMKLLATKLYEIKQAEQHEKIASARRSQVGTGDRSERIRTYNYPQGRVSDHRIGLTLYSLESFLNGDIGEMLDALAAADAAERLKNSEA
ncbi:MAG: peptide chain release factor 1 [Clostridia bacterium]|nr:peptide chain release factor 1 [Clostridia bacterium]